MKNRYTAPYGYTIIKGVTEIHPDEAAVVRRIFADYLAGASLLRIAEDLKTRNIEYLPGEIAWNKNRGKRILEDTRYTGATGLPPIIDEATQKRAGAAKGARNNQAWQFCLSLGRNPLAVFTDKPLEFLDDFVRVPALWHEKLLSRFGMGEEGIDCGVPI